MLEEEDGNAVGPALGSMLKDGAVLGTELGETTGISVGPSLGSVDGVVVAFVGLADGNSVGPLLGDSVGTKEL